MERSVAETEKLIIKTWKETDKGVHVEDREQEKIVDAVRKLLDFFDNYDYIENTQHAEIIKQIYLSGRKIYGSQVAHSMKLHVGVNTLNRYRNKYVRLFNRFRP